jgi:hypothetical protein
MGLFTSEGGKELVFLFTRRRFSEGGI